MNTITNRTFDEERALYGEHDITVNGCKFDGPADGESAFKECGNVAVDNCFFKEFSHKKLCITKDFST